jgi:hypothetical protein
MHKSCAACVYMQGSFASWVDVQGQPVPGLSSGEGAGLEGRPGAGRWSTSGRPETVSEDGSPSAYDQTYSQQRYAGQALNGALGAGSRNANGPGAAYGHQGHASAADAVRQEVLYADSSHLANGDGQAGGAAELAALRRRAAEYRAWFANCAGVTLAATEQPDGSTSPYEPLLEGGAAQSRNPPDRLPGSIPAMLSAIDAAARAKDYLLYLSVRDALTQPTNRLTQPGVLQLTMLHCCAA